MSDKGYERAERPLSYTVAFHPWGGPWKMSLGRVSSRTAVGPTSSKDAHWGSRREWNKMLDGLRERVTAWLCMHGHLNTEGRLFLVETGPMKIWLQ